jgi:hypothetical protein
VCHGGVAIGARHEHRELVAANACSVVGHGDGAVQDLAKPAQQRIARVMAKLIIGFLQPIQVDDDRGDRPQDLRSSLFSSSE